MSELVVFVSATVREGKRKRIAVVRSNIIPPIDSVVGIDEKRYTVVDVDFEVNTKSRALTMLTYVYLKEH